MTKHSKTTTPAPTHAHAAKTEAAPMPATAASTTDSSSASPPASALSPTTGTALVFLTPPPANAKIPAPPAGAASPGGANYRSRLPTATELATLPGAVSDLKRFATFAQVFAVTGLPYAQVLQAFDVGSQWSTMRVATSAWQVYCMIQEGIAWGTIRAMMDSLRPVFEIACAADASLATTYPSLAALFGARKAISAKAVATKRANKAAVARGEAPVHGVVGKRRQKAANKAIVAAAKGAAAAPVVAPAPTPVTVPPANGTPSSGSSGAAH
jgi:hypothetical protein